MSLPGIPICSRPQQVFIVKILFLRIGIDRGCGGRLSPIATDRTFEYIPIPEGCPTINGIRYSDLPSRSGGRLDQLLGHDGYAHYDPNFVAFSYGEPSHPKRSQLLRLSSDDYLVFYAGFQGESLVSGTCCVIGYFVVSNVHRIAPGESWPPPSLSYLDNAHFRRLQREDSLVVVEGETTKSKLLTHAIHLSDQHQEVLPSVYEAIGFSGSVKRSIGRWVPQTHIQSALSWIQGVTL